MATCDKKCWTCPKLDKYNSLFLKGYTCKEYGFIGHEVGVISYQAERGKFNAFELADKSLMNVFAQIAEKKHRLTLNDA